MSRRNPAKDQVAIVGIGRTAFSRELPGRTDGSLVLEASKRAVLDAGLTAADIDGICGDGSPVGVSAAYVGSALGIDGVTFMMNPGALYIFSLASACNAIAAGQCETAIVFHSAFRSPGMSRQAAKDPFRVRAMSRPFGSHGVIPENILGGVSYPLWASRYFHEYKLNREQLAKVALSDRANAIRNSDAVMREPLTLEQYLTSRYIQEPLCLLDMDVPIDGATATVLTTRERARDLKNRPILIHVAGFGMTDHPEEDQQPDLLQNGQRVAMKALWARSDLTIDDIDLWFPYDGFSILALAWTESVGFCGPGEAGDFLDANWDHASGTVRIRGKVPLNSHGGALSEGRTQGAGHVYEAVMQLRGDAGARQEAGPASALSTAGGLFFNSQAILLRTDT